MRAVWSHWSKPFLQRRESSWLSPLHHLLAWGLSLRLARRHYPETMLVTDHAGKALLVDSLGLSFSQVSTELESIRNADAGWWALGKLVAYSMQEQPFVHLDTDVFLWKPLPPSLANAAVFAQCPEEHSVFTVRWKPHDVEAAFAHHNLPLPAEFEWSRSRCVDRFREANCGIIGGNRTDFVRYYANLAKDLVLNPAHAKAWAAFDNKGGYNMIVEQFMLDACVEYHRSNPESPLRGITMRYLFSSIGEAMNQEAAACAGFTHLWVDAKRNHQVSRRLEQRTQDEDIHFYRHCLHLSRNSSQVMAAVGG